MSCLAPCKGIHGSLGFWIPHCGFRILTTGFRIPAQWILDSKKGWIPIFFCFNAFLRISFSCSNLAILKDVVRMHNKFVFFFDLQITGRMYYSSVRVYGLIMRGTLRDCPHRNAAEKKKNNNKHPITAN